MGTKTYRTDGFTLVELMIVVVLIAILAVMAIMAYRGQVSKANDAKRKTDISRIKVAVEEYEKDHNCYPQSVACGVDKTQSVYPYLNNVPCDPLTNTSYIYEVPTESQCPSWYRFYLDLQNPQDPAITPGIGPKYAFNYVTGSANSPDAKSVPSGSSPTPTSTPVENGYQYYGCRSGVCVKINGPECGPNFRDSSCYGQCQFGHECIMSGQ